MRVGSRGAALRAYTPHPTKCYMMPFLFGKDIMKRSEFISHLVKGAAAIPAAAAATDEGPFINNEIEVERRQGSCRYSTSR